MAENTTDRRVRKTRGQLRQGLVRLMREKSIQDITVKELCEECDINRGTFYLHYKDIYDLVEQIENELFQEFEPFYKRMCLCLYFSGQISVFQRCHLRIELYTRSCLFVANTFKSPHEVQVPVSSSEFPICNDVESQLFLLCDYFCNCLINDSITFFFCDLSFTVICFCLFYFLWS